MFGVGSDDDDDDDLDHMTSELAVTKSLGGNTAAVLKKSREPGASSLFDSDDGDDASDADEFSKEVGCLIVCLALFVVLNCIEFNFLHCRLN